MQLTESGAPSSDAQREGEPALERMTGVVERITYHNAESGWTVLKVSPFRDPGRLLPVLVHQIQVFAGATMEFWGSYSHHPKHGEQFKAVRALEKKPASAAALEKYLGSGLIRGVGPAIARRIVGHFRERTLEVFESQIDDLLSVPGIAHKKLSAIRSSWAEHRAIRDVMLFLQGHGISTLFATKIFKTYGDASIEVVSKNPYRLAHDIYGIGFFSADRIALALGFATNGVPRVEAAVKHVLAACRDDGHCFLTEDQISTQIPELLREDIPPERVCAVLASLVGSDQVRRRAMPLPPLHAGRPDESSPGSTSARTCYYSRSLFHDEALVADHIARRSNLEVAAVEAGRVDQWLDRYCTRHATMLSGEQAAAIRGIVGRNFSILTGGPGCGKTTTTRVLVKLLEAMHKKVLLAAPTGRAAQRMTEVIGKEAKTLHRLLEWAPTKGGFKRDETDPLPCDFLIVDETSMLDISLAASLVKALPAQAQLLFIGDPDQLPAVGPGAVLLDLLRTGMVARFCLTKVFRQAESSSIIRFAHEINRGIVPKILSPVACPSAFRGGHDCLFVDADEATREQAGFIHRVRAGVSMAKTSEAGTLLKANDDWTGRIVSDGVGEVEIDRLYRPNCSETDEATLRAPVITIPKKFQHVDLEKLCAAPSTADELKHLLKNVHPWSSINYGLTAFETVVRLYIKTIPEWLGPSCETQILTPQVRGTLGTLKLNEGLQEIANPEAPGKSALKIGEKTLRVGDRVIQTRNNYELGVYNGDIGRIVTVDPSEMVCQVAFAGPDNRIVTFARDDLSELSLAYAITIHKSQGSEFEAVIIPVLGQHFSMLFRNLIYTGLTRARKLAIFVGTRRALVAAIGQVDSRKRQTGLTYLVDTETRYSR